MREAAGEVAESPTSVTSPTSPTSGTDTPLPDKAPPLARFLSLPLRAPEHHDGEGEGAGASITLPHPLPHSGHGGDHGGLRVHGPAWDSLRDLAKRAMHQLVGPPGKVLIAPVVEGRIREVSGGMRNPPLGPEVGAASTPTADPKPTDPSPIVEATPGGSIPSGDHGDGDGH